MIPIFLLESIVTMSWMCGLVYASTWLGQIVLLWDDYILLTNRVVYQLFMTLGNHKVTDILQYLCLFAIFFSTRTLFMIRYPHFPWNGNKIRIG